MFRLFLTAVSLSQYAAAGKRTEIVPAGDGLVGEKTVLINDMKKGSVVFEQKLAEVIHADGAAEAVFGEAGGSEKHELSAILSENTDDTQSGPSTAYTPPHLLVHDDKATELAIAIQLITKYGSWYSNHFIFDQQDIEQLSPGFQTEFSLITKRADEWFSVLSRLQSPSWRSRLESEDQRTDMKKRLLWASLVLRQHGLLSPFGTLISPETVGIRQAHSNCNVLGLEMPDSETVVGVLMNDAKKGTEVCIAYSPSLSRQELLVRHYIWDTRVPIGIHYYIPETEEEDPTLQSNKCLPGEIFLSNGKLTAANELCFKLAQLPSNVRHDYRELFKGKEAEQEVLASLGTLAHTALDSYYAAPLSNYSFDSSVTSLQVGSVFDMLDTRGDEGDMPPELIALIKERQEQGEVRDSDRHDTESEAMEEEEEEYVAIPELETEELVDVVPTPEYVVRLDEKLQSVVPDLRKFLMDTHRRWTSSAENIELIRRSYDDAEAARVREQVRRNLEDYELSGDL